MHAYHRRRTIYRISFVSRNSTQYWRAALERNHARGGLESHTSDSHDQCERSSRRKTPCARSADRRYRRRDLHGNQPFLVDRRQTLQLSIRLRNWMGDQKRKAWAYVQESVLLWHHHRILELDGCHLLPRRMAPVGDTELRQRSAHADHGYWTWRGPGPLSQHRGRERLQGHI